MLKTSQEGVNWSGLQIFKRALDHTVSENVHSLLIKTTRLKR